MINLFININQNSKQTKQKYSKNIKFFFDIFFNFLHNNNLLKFCILKANHFQKYKWIKNVNFIRNSEFVIAIIDFVLFIPLLIFTLFCYFIYLIARVAIEQHKNKNYFKQIKIKKFHKLLFVGVFLRKILITFIHK